MARIKRVLMLADPESDNLAYMMFDGLYKVLGKDNVFVCPFIKYFQGGIDEWWQNGNRRFTSPLAYCCKHESRESTLDELVNNINSFDIIYLSSTRSYAENALKQFIERCGRDRLPPLICSEGEDSSGSDHIERIKKLYNPVVCFKREFLQSNIDRFRHLKPIYPLPFSAPVNSSLFPDNPNKDIDICVQFGDTHPVRESIIKKLLENEMHNRCNAHITINGFLFEPKRINIDSRIRNTIRYSQYNDYMKFMSRSKINIIARGNGFDTVRRFEAPCFSGLVLSDNIPIVTPYPFIGGEHVIYYSNELTDLVQQIEYYLSHDEERIKIGKAGREHCMRYHTTEARARYFLNKVEEHI